MTGQTKGSIEAEIAKAVVKFHREQQGRGPADVHAHIVGDLVLVQCTGILTINEGKLAVTEEGRRLILSARRELRSINHQEIEETISTIVDAKVQRSYGDVNVEAGEMMEVYVLDADVERRLLRQDLNRLGEIK